MVFELTTSSTDVSFIASQAIARSQQQQNGYLNDTPGDRNGDAMDLVERQSETLTGFVAAKGGPEGGNGPLPNPVPLVANPDVLEVDLDE